MRIMRQANRKDYIRSHMKNSKYQVFFILLIVCCVFTKSVNAQSSLLEKRISINANNIEMQSFLKLVEKQVPVKFSYSPSVIDPQTKITYNGNNVTLGDVLKSVFDGQNVQYKYIDNKIILVPKSKQNDDESNAASSTQDRQLKGFVTDSVGKPLGNAFVQITGSTKGVSTKEDGSFMLTIPSGAISVTVSYVGYNTEVVDIESKDNIIVVLKTAANAMQEVVVTALGISKQQKNLGYAVTSVNSNLFNQAKEPNIANSLSGRVAGLNINSVSSGPGSSARILLRGVSNFSGSTSPLIIIDGVPMSNNQNGSAGVYGGADMGDGISSLNPDDIENITVLKGSTSSALYGTRASNGVILVTTKSGKGANKFAVEYTTNMSVNSVINYEDYQKVYGQGSNGERPTTVAGAVASGILSWGEKFDGAPTMGLDGNMHPYSPVENQLDKFYRLAPVFINTVSVVNGGKNGNMRLSLSNTNNQSVIPNSYLKRYSANLNITQNISDKLKVTAMINYLNENVKNRPYLNDMSRNPNWTMFLLPGNVDPKILKPGYIPANNIVGEDELALSSDGYTTNPWFAAYRGINNTTRNRFTSSTSIRYDFSKALYAQGRLGLDYLNDGVLNIEPVGTGYKELGGLQEQSTAKSTELNMDALLGYNKKISNDFNINVLGGISQRQYNYDKVGYVGGSQWSSLPYTVGNLVNAAQPIQPSNYTGDIVQRIKTNSAYYSADFGYKQFLNLSTTGRWDWYSEALSKNLPVFAPSVSASFLFSNLVNIPQLSYGKLRAAYAETNGEPRPFQTQVYYLPQSTNNGITYGTTNPQASILDIAPFKMKELEVGLETRWFEGRFGVNATYFSKRTKNELIAQTLSIATGATSIYAPLGSTSNKGLELELTGTPIRKNDFQWDVSFNFTSVKNKLVESGDVTGTIRADGQGQYRPSVGPFNTSAFVASQKGLPLYQIYAYDYSYDANGNIITNSGIPMRGELTAMGSGIPKYYGGLNNSFRYKNFNLGFLIDYRFGAKVLSGTNFLTMYDGLDKNTLAGRETGILAKGVDYQTGLPNTTVVSAQSYYQNLARNVTTITVYDGSFIKLRQISLGYAFTPDILAKTFFESINVSLVARNLLILMKNTPNIDPEDSYSSLPGNAGLQSIGVPPTRTFGVNVDFKFKN